MNLYLGLSVELFSSCSLLLGRNFIFLVNVLQRGNQCEKQGRVSISCNIDGDLMQNSICC